MVSLLKLLEKTSGTIHYLANVLNVSTRTIQRDIEILRNAGFPISNNVLTNELTLVSNYNIPAINFTQTEVLAILVLFEEYGTKIGEPVFSTMTTAAYKIASTLSPEFLDLVSSVQRHLHVSPSPTNINTNYTDFFQDILDAIIARRVLNIQYQSPLVPDAIHTLLHPYMVLFVRSWYVIGFSSLYQEIRTFKISRVQCLTKTEELFEMPAHFSMEQYLGNAWNLIPEPGQDEEVIVRFSRLVAQNVSEIRWHKTQEVLSLDDGRVELRFKVSGIKEIAWWILGYGAEVEVIHPPTLRHLIADHVQRMTLLYMDRIIGEK